MPPTTMPEHAPFQRGDLVRNMFLASLSDAPTVGTVTEVGAARVLVRWDYDGRVTEVHPATLEHWTDPEPCPRNVPEDVYVRSANRTRGE